MKKLRDDSILVIGGDAKASDRVGIRGPSGRRRIDCELCGTPCYFAPSSFEIPAIERAVFVCMPCARPYAAGSEPIPTTDAQRREYEQAGLDPDEVAKRAKAIVGALTWRPSDEQLTTMREMCELSIGQAIALPAVPPTVLLPIISELIEHRKTKGTP